MYKILKVVRPKLFFDGISPPAISCLLGIHAMKLDIQLIKIDLFKGENLKEDFLKINNLHTVPVFKDKDLILTDSHAILFHMASSLAHKSSQFSLGDDKNIQSKVLNRLFFNACVLFRRDADVMNEIFQKQKLDWDLHQLKIKESYSYLNDYLKDSKFVACDQITIADLSVVATASTLDLLVPITPNKWKNLFEWFQRIKALPYYKTSNEDGLINLKEKIIQYGCFKF